jgi:hypothetical protein
MIAIVSILVYLAIGLCVGLFEQRDAVLGFGRPPSAFFWISAAVLGAPVLAVSIMFWLFDAITGRR